MAINLDRQVLRDELDTDPMGFGYASMTGAEAAEALNAPRPQGTRQAQVDYGEVLDRAAQSDSVRAALGRIFASAETSAKQFVERMRYVGSMETAEGTGGYAILTALVIDGVLTQQEAEAFVAWGEEAVPEKSRAQDLWGNVTITETDIAEARAL